MWPHYVILEVCWDDLWTLFGGLLQFHGYGSWLVCEVALRPNSNAHLDKAWTTTHPAKKIKINKKSVQSAFTSSGNCVCYSIHQMQLQTCRQPWSNKQNHSSTREVWNHPKGSTQNFSIFSVDVVILVCDMAVWRSRQTLGLNNTLNEVVISSDSLLIIFCPSTCLNPALVETWKCYWNQINN